MTTIEEEINTQMEIITKKILDFNDFYDFQSSKKSFKTFRIAKHKSTGEKIFIMKTLHPTIRMDEITLQNHIRKRDRMICEKSLQEI